MRRSIHVVQYNNDVDEYDDEDEYDDDTAKRRRQGRRQGQGQGQGQGQRVRVRVRVRVIHERERPPEAEASMAEKAEAKTKAKPSPRFSRSAPTALPLIAAIAATLAFLLRCHLDAHYWSSSLLRFEVDGNVLPAALSTVGVAVRASVHSNVRARTIAVDPVDLGRRLSYAAFEYEDEDEDDEESTLNATATATKRLRAQPRPKRRTVDVSKEDMSRQERLGRDDKYDGQRGVDLRSGGDNDGCEPLRPWQESSHPSCNKVHEVDRSVRAWVNGRYRFMTEGGFNSVFVVGDDSVDVGDDNGNDGSYYVLKQLEFANSNSVVTDDVMSVVRMDALVMERLTSSRYVIDIYAHCGITVAVAMATGQLGKEIFDVRRDQTLSLVARHSKLRLAVQASSALADIENVDGDGIPAFVHMDYLPRQYLMVNGTLKLSDFNKGRFVTAKIPSVASVSKSPSSENGAREPCLFRRIGTDGIFRSPEEYKYDDASLTPKTQIYSLGNLIQCILMGEMVWKGEDNHTKARELIASGRRAPLPPDLVNSTDPINVALIKAMDMCFVFDPMDRYNAMDVAAFLKKEADWLHVDYH